MRRGRRGENTHDPWEGSPSRPPRIRPSLFTPPIVSASILYDASAGSVARGRAGLTFVREEGVQVHLLSLVLWSSHPSGQRVVSRWSGCAYLGWHGCRRLGEGWCSCEQL